jgi:riboflavin biosynthesis pyrimidine reductase
VRLVTFNVASIDGRIGTSRSTPSWLDTRWKPLDRFQPVDVLSLHDARISLQGSNSFTARDAPEAVFDGSTEANVPAGAFLPGKLHTHPGRWLVVIDSRARVRWTTFEQDDTKLAVLLSSTTPAAYRQFLREHDVPYFEVGDGRVDLRQAVDRLGQIFGVDCIVSDAGGVLNGALLQAGLVDEIDIQFLPAVVGRAEAPLSSRATTSALRAVSVTFALSPRRSARMDPSSSVTQCTDRAARRPSRDIRQPHNGGTDGCPPCWTALPDVPHRSTCRIRLGRRRRVGRGLAKARARRGERRTRRRATAPVDNLRHTGNQFAANSDAALKDLMEEHGGG